MSGENCICGKNGYPLYATSCPVHAPKVWDFLDCGAKIGIVYKGKGYRIPTPPELLRAYEVMPKSGALRRALGMEMG